ncbi:MAG: hydroxymethylglutaryl-CoA synthase [Planctomycetes bacterium]|nr:hydroxymethylglutaryl-CoA synthase [Planctomycetota bacterium]
MQTGIISYGTCIPKHRINVKDIFNVWRNVTPEIFDRMSLSERCVLLPDEDSVTMAVSSAQLALDRSGLARDKIGALVFGTCTNPFDTKASSTIILDALGLRNNIICYDLQFGTKSGSSAIIAAASLVESGMAEYAIAVGSDTLNRHFPPGTQMEYSASAGAFACVLGKKDLIAKIEGFTTYASDLSDYFRPEGERYIQLGGGWIGHVSNWGLLEHTIPCSKELFAKLKLDPSKDFAGVALPQANGVQPMMVAGTLGLDMFLVMQSVLTPSIGNCGSASALIPLAKLFDYAGANERLFVCSYGCGAGADCLSIVTTPAIESKHPSKNTVDEQIDDKILIDYALASKYEFKYVRSPFMLTNYL